MKIKVIDMLVKMRKDKNYKPTFKYKDTIYQYDFKTKYYTPSFMGLYKIYNSLKEAKKDLNNKNAHITEVCQGKLNKTCGHSFKYLREEEMTY